MEAQESAEHADATAAESEPARPLNRAERRAQEHHKKTGTKPGSSNSGFGKGAGGGKSVGGGHSNTAIPRTGHK